MNSRQAIFIKVRRKRKKGIVRRVPLVMKKLEYHQTDHFKIFSFFA
jgi:hypothetical protein